MDFIRPTPITDANLVSSTVLENDYPVWVSNQAYVAGEYVIRTETHRVYLCNGDVTSTTPPEEDLVHWTDISPTNRWAMFDTEINTKTEQAESIEIVITPGMVNALSIHEVYSRYITVDFAVDGASVFNATYDLFDPDANVGDWLGWVLEPIEVQSYLYIDQLFDVGLLNVPAYSNGTLTLTFSSPGGTVSIGEFKTGLLFHIGDTQNDFDLGITDYSLRKIDEFGRETYIARNASKDVKAEVVIDTYRLDSVFNMLYRYKDEDLVFVPAKQHGAAIVYGKSTWRIKRKNSILTSVSMTIEGRT